MSGALCGESAAEEAARPWKVPVLSVPTVLLERDDLTSTEVLFLADLWHLQGSRGCWQSNASFARKFRINERHVPRMIQSLEGKGLISVEVAGGNKRFIKVLLEIKIGRGGDNLSSPGVTRRSPLISLENTERQNTREADQEPSARTQGTPSGTNKQRTAVLNKRLGLYRQLFEEKYGVRPGPFTSGDLSVARKYLSVPDAEFEAMLRKFFGVTDDRGLVRERYPLRWLSNKWNVLIEVEDEWERESRIQRERTARNGHGA